MSMRAEYHPFSKIIGGDTTSRDHYHVPKYQREYTWGKKEWEKLTQDLEENDLGYFMGPIICVHDSGAVSPNAETIYEIVDGQQRLITLSLLMSAVYEKIKNLKSTIDESDDDAMEEYRESLASLRNRLRKKKKDFEKGELGGFAEGGSMLFLRVRPSSQNSNLVDYLYILGDLGLVRQTSKPRFWGRRRIAKAYSFFKKNAPSDMDGLNLLANRIKELTFVLILVPTQSNAFVLFETLNNRGLPLSAIDIIKNKMLAEMEIQKSGDIDQTYEEWQEFMKHLPDSEDQERFLRQFYNAFKTREVIRIESIARATKPKIIEIYETLIKKDARSILDDLKAKAELYSQFTDPSQNVDDSSLEAALLEISRIGAAPSYQVLLYLFALDSAKVEGSDFKTKAVELLCKYYFRRNITDIPSTRELDPAHIELIEKCEERIKEGSKLTIQFLEQNLLDGRGKPASLTVLRSALEGDMYSTNAWMTRCALIKVDSLVQTKEYAPDLWCQNEKGKYVWTIEHVFPQGDNLPSEWIDMIAEGVKERAEELQEEYVHRLGNLTLSGYNTELSNAPFDKKQAKQQDRKFHGHKINIGYKNGLALNNLTYVIEDEEKSLSTASAWTAECIEARTKVVVDQLIECHKFSGE